MSDFISRLSEEKSQLDEKIAKLEAFTKSDDFNGIDNVQRGLLKIQLNTMATYSQILDERLWRLSPSVIRSANLLRENTEIRDQAHEMLAEGSCDDEPTKEEVIDFLKTIART